MDDGIFARRLGKGETNRASAENNSRGDSTGPRVEYVVCVDLCVRLSVRLRTLAVAFLDRFTSKLAQT